MFRRKDEAYDTDDLLQDVMSGIEDDELLEAPAPEKSEQPKEEAKPMKSESETKPAANNNAAPKAAAPASKPAPAAALNKPAPAAAFRPSAQPSARNVPAAAERSTPAAANPKASKRVLTVGHDIHMKGEISTCDRLVIEGSVDASLNEVHTVEIAQTGSFKGAAEIEDAEISGTFEGDLIVNGRLTIYGSGQVSGNVAYGEIEIERGGRLTGSIKTADEMRAERSQRPMKKAA